MASTHVFSMYVGDPGENKYPVPILFHASRVGGAAVAGINQPYVYFLTLGGTYKYIAARL